MRGDQRVTLEESAVLIGTVCAHEALGVQNWMAEARKNIRGLDKANDEMPEFLLVDGKDVRRRGA